MHFTFSTLNIFCNNHSLLHTNLRRTIFSSIYCIHSILEMIQYWFRYNWHWLSAAFVFSVVVLCVAISTKFKEKWAYEAVGYPRCPVSVIGSHKKRRRLDSDVFLCDLASFVKPHIFIY
jgi:hypothetical protein